MIKNKNNFCGSCYKFDVIFATIISHPSELFTPSLEEDKKSYPVFDHYVENTFLIWLHMNWFDNIFDEIFDYLINKYHNKNLNLLKV